MHSATPHLSLWYALVTLTGVVAAVVIYVLTRDVVWTARSYVSSFVAMGPAIDRSARGDHGDIGDHILPDIESWLMTHEQRVDIVGVPVRGGPRTVDVERLRTNPELNLGLR